MIFVSIICLDDLDVQATCLDLVSKARYPEELRIVVVLQTDRLEEFEIDLSSAAAQLEIHWFPMSWAKGVGKARAYAYRQLDAEDYYLQLDCHMRFQQDWDELLLSELERCPPKAVLTALPPGFIIETGQLLSMTPTIPTPHRFFGSVLACRAIPVLPDGSPPRVAVLAAGLVFSRVDAIDTAPPDPYYHYLGEELSHSLRLWTNGYEIFGVRPLIAHHAYREQNDRGDVYENVHAHWRSTQRIRGLLGEPRERLSSVAVQALDSYGLGTVRTLESWEETFGVDLRRRTLGTPH